MEDIEIDGEIFGCSPPSDRELGADFALMDEAEVDTSKVIDRGPGGHYYYDDVIGADTIEWCFAYARQHPEDEYIQERVRHFQDMNRVFRERTGRSMLGYDTTYFPEDAVPNPDFDGCS